MNPVVGAARRGFSKARNGAADFVTLVRETRGHDTDPDLVRTEPVDTEPVFGPPEELDTAPVISRAEPPPAEPQVVNFDEAVKLGEEDEPEEDPPTTETVAVQPPETSEAEIAVARAPGWPAES